MSQEFNYLARVPRVVGLRFKYENLRTRALKKDFDCEPHNLILQGMCVRTVHNTFTIA